MVIINSEGGRIGEMWWFNAEPGTPREVSLPLMIGPIETNMMIRQRVVRWGGFGIGRDVTIKWETIDG